MWKVTKIRELNNFKPFQEIFATTAPTGIFRLKKKEGSGKYYQPSGVLMRSWFHLTTLTKDSKISWTRPFNPKS